MIYLVRHAHAGGRRASPEDHLRGLSVRGLREARALSEWLEPGADGLVLSSPFVRCVATVEPIAARRGREVILTATLAERGRIDRLLRLLKRVPEGSILCTHGDMLEGVITRLASGNTQISGPVCLQKGVVWVLTREQGAFSQAWAIPPHDETQTPERDGRVEATVASEVAG